MPTRREFLVSLSATTVGSALAGSLALAGCRSVSESSEDANAPSPRVQPMIQEDRIMPIELPPLPYARDALAPHISENTLNFHYGKHHSGYVTKVNAAIEGTPNAGKSLEDLIMSADGGLFNNAAQVWNHSFYWNSMKPGGGGEPSGDIAAAIDADFGGYDDFRKAFADAAATQFGSGWAWLVLDDGKLAIVKSANADLPMKHEQTALLTIDVWEHAYYLDYQNARPKYIDSFLDHLVNWDHVNEQLAAAK